MDELSNWGKYPTIQATVQDCQNQEEVMANVRQATMLTARGNGRCYGDSSLGKNMISILQMNQVLHFDEEKGTITAEAGMLLDQLLTFVLPRGFILPVLPGTKFISLGGAVAANVHGKNHVQAGALSEWIRSIKLVNELGQIVHCSPTEAPKLFANTIGGMGLTGIILEVSLQLRPIETAYFTQSITACPNLEKTLSFLQKKAPEAYTVAWLDGLQRGKTLGCSLVTTGKPLTLKSFPDSLRKQALEVHSAPRLSIPFDFPSLLLNPWSIRAFNLFYFYWKKRQREAGPVHYNSFFFPLDAMQQWNRLYGKNGLLQYQFVLPFENAEQGLVQILTTIHQSACTPNLSVLKVMGKASKHAASISFPMPGFTLAVDFKRNSQVLDLLHRLDEIVIRYKGRVYLAKDARLSKAHFKAMYPESFKHPDLFQSLQSKRLLS